ncbi:atlastin-2-like [Amphibalanus amphitrite]|uniref:atlastin-2-like n=1 Tax=Amphibalanus amphitrite TaxID=1232801 RepID=UPI001C90225E|nr:atlastin-2-like [Amphibalanus amphitrite]
MQPKQIISVIENGESKELHLHEENLRALLSESDQNSPVVVLSVTGAYRTGKSFLLNSMVRYLTAPDKTRWLDYKAESFEWKSGSEPHTNGMVMSQPTPITLPSGEEALLILMDTQGLYDTNSRVTDSAKIFVLSTVVSSLSVFNLMQDLKGNDLEFLQLFADFGRRAVNSADETAFMDLLFLIRDWAHPEDHPFGSHGGKALVERRLNSDGSITSLREEFRRCFSSVDGFLLPYPGRVVAERSSFNGDPKDMESDFVEKLDELMSELFTPATMSRKMVAGGPLTCRKLMKFMRTFVNCVESYRFADIDSLVKAMNKAGKLTALQDEFDNYVQKMEEVWGDDVMVLDEKSLDKAHESAKAAVLHSFRRRVNARDTCEPDGRYCTSLENKVEEEFSRRKNGTRQTLKAFHECSEKTKKVVDECIAVYRKHIDLCEYSRWNPLRYTPNLEKTIRGAHEIAKKKALDAFEEKTEKTPELIKEPFKDALESALDGILSEAMGWNKTLKLIWGALGVGLLVGAGTVLLLSPCVKMRAAAAAVAVTLGVGVGSACIYYMWDPISEFMVGAGKTAVGIVDAAGEVLVDSVRLVGPEVLADVIRRSINQHRSESCTVKDMANAFMPC